MTMVMTPVSGTNPDDAMAGAPGWTWPSGGGFHWSQGWFFTRRDSGAVQIRRYADSREGTEPVMDITIPCAEWASIVASVSRSGETAGAYNAAIRLHTEPTP